MVVKKIIENHGNVSKAMREVGYTEATAKNPKKNLTDTAGYKKIAEPFVEQMEKERLRIIEAMTIKDLDSVQYQHLAEVVDKFTKNIQLLSGQSTENNKVTFGWNEDNDSVST